MDYDEQGERFKEWRSVGVSLPTLAAEAARRKSEAVVASVGSDQRRAGGGPGDA